jgi:hypothetical protein
MRRSLLIAAMLALLAGGGYAAYWLETAREIEAAVPAWAEAQRTEGYALQWQGLTVGGFPFAFRVHVAGAVLHAARPIPYDARADILTAAASPFDLRTWRVAAPDGVALGAPSLLAGLDAAAFAGSVALGGGTIVIALTAHEITGNGSLRGFAADAFDAQLGLPQRGSTSRDTALTLSARLQQAMLPTIPAPLSRRLDALSLTATVQGPWESGGFRRALVAWRDAGGTIEVANAHVEWGGTIADLTGTLALDAAMQPEGAMTASVVGADKAVDAAVAAGALQQRYAGIAKSVLRAISAKDDTGADALHLPLTIQDQRVYVGPAAVAALPHVDWP